MQEALRRKYSVVPDRLLLERFRPPASSDPIAQRQAPPLTLDNLGRNRHLGSLAAQEETSGEGPGTVSTGRGDAGGVSYGSYQLATNRKTPDLFLETEGRPWAAAFAGLKPGTPGFSAAWRETARRDPEAFHLAQHDHIDRTHYQPQVARILRATGYDVNTAPLAVQEAVWSTAVQHGPWTDKVVKAIRDAGPRASPADVVRGIYGNRARGHPATAERYSRELESALQLPLDKPLYWDGGSPYRLDWTGTKREPW